MSCGDGMQAPRQTGTIQPKSLVALLLTFAAGVSIHFADAEAGMRFNADNLSSMVAASIAGEP